MKYIVEGMEGGPYGTDDRPTQEQFKTYGEGDYVLRRGDGSITKKFRVVRNRSGNLAVTSFTPEGLEGISTLNLSRMQRDYGRIVKLWPGSASARDYKKVVTEIQSCAAIVGISTESAPVPKRRVRATNVAVAS